VISTTTTLTTTRVKVVSKAINNTRQIIVRPVGNDVYVGGSDVTTSNGLLISNNTNFTIVIPPDEELWAVVPSGTSSITVLTSYAPLQ